MVPIRHRDHQARSGFCGRLERTTRWTIALATSILLFGCAGPSNDPSELDKVWTETVVDIMGNPPTAVTGLGGLAVPAKAGSPAAVYLHGCGGRGNTAHSHIRFLKLNGFAVFAPDHWSRPGAQRVHCDDDSATGSVGRSIYQFRHAEAKRARDGLRQIPWVDQSNVVLVGHSQGGNAVASYPFSDDFSKIVAITTDCGNGIQSHTPVLAVYAEKDAWFRRSSTRCNRFNQSNAEVLVLPGGNHNFILDTMSLATDEKSAYNAIARFLGFDEKK